MVLTPTERGGYVCPVSWCDHREYTPSMLDQHVTETHPDEEQP